MKTVFGIVSAAAAAGAVLAIAPVGIASAEPELNGTYTFTVDWTKATTNGFALKDPEVRTQQWVVAPCGAGCARVTVPDNPEGGGELRLVNGRWEMTTEIRVINCTPGQPDVTTVTSLDPATLHGTVLQTLHCAGNNVNTAPATLTAA